MGVILSPMAAARLAAVLLVVLAAPLTARNASTEEQVSFGPSGRFQLEFSNDVNFGMRSHGVIETIGPGRTKFYPLPQSTFAQYARLRPEDLRATRSLARYERQEFIGPYQIQGGRLWFGNNFYDSEGMRGVGAFGYFDTTSRNYTLFSPPEVAQCEMSAILAEPDAVWLGLDRFGEDISKGPCGFARWNKNTHEIEEFQVEFLIDSIRREGDLLRLETPNGYALLQDGKFRRFLANGKPIAKFPPPPTQY
jgi:hypothetical protein